MRFFRLFLKYASPILYYLDKAPVLLSQNGDRIFGAVSQKTFRVVILGKHAYYETTAVFPFSDIKEIKAAVRLDPTAYAPFAADLFFVRKITRKQEQTRVNLWFVRGAAATFIDQKNIWIALPETALLSAVGHKKPGVYIVKRPDDQLLVHVDGDGAVRSTLTPETEGEIEAFQRSLGPDGQTCSLERTPSFEKYLQTLANLMKQASPAAFFPFLCWRPDSAFLSKPFARRFFVSLLIMLGVYGILWAGLPYWKHRQLFQENQQLTATLGDVLTKQAQIDAIQQQIRKMAQPITNHSPKGPLFNTLYQALSGKAVLTRMTVAGNRVEITGRSPQTSIILSALSEIDHFENVQLTAPSRKDFQTGQDIFTISFRLGPQKHQNGS